MTSKTHFQEGDAEFLLPQDVGSSVRWFVTVQQMKGRKGKLFRPEISMEVGLSDCSRTITWSEYDDGVKMGIKLDKAIKQLKKARKALKEAQAVYATLPQPKDDD